MRSKDAQKQLARTSLSPEMTKHPQSPVFGLAVLYLTGSDISRFCYVNTWARKSVSNNFLLYLPIYWGDFIEQIQKICHTHFKFQMCLLGSVLNFLLELKVAISGLK